MYQIELPGTNPAIMESLAYPHDWALFSYNLEIISFDLSSSVWYLLAHICHIDHVFVLGSLVYTEEWIFFDKLVFVSGGIIEEQMTLNLDQSFQDTNFNLLSIFLLVLDKP
jgi:hypothetical protein